MRDLSENQVRSWDDVPEFANEAEEAEFWSTHGFGQGILGQMGPLDDALPPARPPAPVTLHFDDDTLGRLKAPAQLKGKRYEQLVKEFIVERLYEDERRSGLVSESRSAGA